MNKHYLAKKFCLYIFSIWHRKHQECKNTEKHRNQNALSSIYSLITKSFSQKYVLCIFHDSCKKQFQETGFQCNQLFGNTLRLCIRDALWGEILL